MKLKLLCVFLFLLSTASLVLYTNSGYKRYNASLNSEQKILNNDIERWYLVAESPNYKIYSSGVQGGYIVVVLDKELDILLVPDSSCDIPITEKMREDGSYFYNNSVGIKSIEAYKSISYDVGKGTFVQTVLNAGTVWEEGTIKLVEEKGLDNNSKTISCDIKIASKLLSR
ncbi:hypothetical protein ACFL13_02545 [Patescibacteria group bacterium]